MSEAFTKSVHQHLYKNARLFNLHDSLTETINRMDFENGHLYHIFNRGNNSQKIFFTRDNYLFFLEKIKNYMSPHADIVAWCLMPNHFHLMVHVNTVEVDVVSDNESLTNDTHRVTRSHPISQEPVNLNIADIDRMTQSHPINKMRSINNSIAIILRSYTRAIQKQQKMTGSLFQPKTKAICLTLNEGVSPAWFQSQFGAILNTSFPEKEYPQVCFDYIHANPVNDGFVENATDWEFSSARDYAGLRNGKLVNQQRAAEFGLVFNYSSGK